MLNKSLSSIFVLLLAVVTGCTTPAGNDRLLALLAGFGGGGAASDALAYDMMSAVYTVHQPITPNEPVCAGADAVVSWSVSPSLPDGLSLDPVTGIISGTPSEVREAAMYTVTAELPEGTAEAVLAITVRIPAPSGLSYPAADPVYDVDEAIAPNVPSVTGTVTEWSVSPLLPDGLSLDPVTGEISGTPSAAQASALYTITAVNSSGSAETTITITIVDCEAPAKVTGLAATQGAYADRVVLSWQSVPGAASYSAFRLDGDGSRQVGGVISGTTVTDSGMDPGPCYYVVVASNGCGMGAYSDVVTGYRAVTDREFFDQAYWEIESVVNWLQSSDLTQSQPAEPGMAGGQFKYDANLYRMEAYLTFSDFSDYYLTVNGMLTIEVNLWRGEGTVTGTLNITGMYGGYVRFDSIIIDLDTSEFTGGHYDVSQDGGTTETEIPYAYMP